MLNELLCVSRPEAQLAKFEDRTTIITTKNQVLKYLLK